MSCIVIPSVKNSLLLPCIFAALVFCILVPETCNAGDGKQEAFLDAQTLIDGWEASYCHIDSLKVSGTRILVNEKGHNPINRKQIPYYHHERIQNGTKFLVRFTGTPQGFDNDADYMINSFDGSIGKEYVNKSDPDSLLRRTGLIYRGLNNRAIEKDNILAEFLQTMPNIFPEPSSGEDEPWKVKLSQQYPLGIPFFLEKYNKALAVGEVKVRPHLETVAGEACHVLELDLRSRIETFWLAHEKGMLPMKTMYVSSPERVTQMVITKEVEEITSVSTETGILWYPRVIMEKSRKLKRGMDYSYVIKVIIEEFVPHYKAPPETFSYVFPNGTLVYDKIKDLRYRTGSSELETEMNQVELDILESGPPEAILSAYELRELYSSMYSSIHNMKVSYTNAVEEIHPDPNTPNATNSSIRYYKVRRIEEGDKYFTSFSYSTVPNDFGESDERLNEYTFDGSVSMEYNPEDKLGRIISGRTGTMYENINDLLEYMLINKVTFGNESKLRITLSMDPQGKVRPHLEQINGQWCHVVESIRPRLPGEPKSGGTTIWFAADKGGLPMKFEKYNGFGKCVKRIFVEKVAAADNQGSKLWYPQEAIMITRFVGRTVEQKFFCHELKVNIETNENTWKIKFPEGTEVYDRVNNLTYRAGD